MRNPKTTTNSSNQIRWVILLLALAVILPTVCLLFFMTQAVKNERLAMRQRMVDFYTKKINEVFPLPSTPLESYQPEVAEIIETGNIDFIAEFIDLRGFEINDSNINRLLFPSPKSNSYTFVIYDSKGVMVHPVLEGIDVLPDGFEDIAEKAYQFEFQDVNIPEAIVEYSKISKDATNKRVRFAADMAKARCLNKVNKKKEAIELLTKLSYLETKTVPKELAGDILRARVMLAGFLDAKTSDDHKYLIERIINKTLSPQTHFPSDTRAWALGRIEPASNLQIWKEEASVRAANKYPNPKSFKDWPERTCRRILSNPVVYGIHFKAGENHFLKTIKGPDVVARLTNGGTLDILDDMVFCRIYNDQGQIFSEQTNTDVQIFENEKIDNATDRNIKYEPLSGEKFFDVSPGENFPDWKIEFYFRSGVFSDAAKRQKIIYVWTGVLLVCLILTVSGFAGKSILKQARLNTLKNDFIATVTHELKTPLASMRVLVDTLLEGSYNDQKQAVEYLQLISKENKRLTGLIDNFLTFSRMERNKQAFELADCPAGDIVNDAAAAVKTKFDKENCGFSVTIGEDVESVYADKDAMVTVLVNLLDNAYKYSGDDKEIELSVYNDNGSVCFAVTDNGMGMSPRVQKKVFERFYQADSKLSRTAEGCGLGLSIVKFIVDAHGGSIDIQSEPEKGTTFNVRIPL